MSFSIMNLFKKEKKATCTAVILAAGSGERMGRDKILMELGGKPVIIRTVEAFERCDCVDNIILVTRSEILAELSDICAAAGFKKLRSVIVGGANRTESALAGVSAVDKKCSLIAIHDGARPFITKEIITAAVECAAAKLAAVPAVRSVDTVRIVDENGVVVACPDRNYVASIQTPQVFNADIIKGALSYAVSKGISLTDDSSAAQLMGVKVHTVPGDVDNIKLTVPEDFVKAAAILKNRGEA